MLQNIFRNMPDVVKNLLLLNVLMFIATIILESKGVNFTDMMGMHYPGSEGFEPYQVVTYMFMHGSLIHIFFNMYALVIFGSMLERVWGPKRFLMYYFITGIGALALHVVVSYFRIEDIYSTMSIEEIEFYKNLVLTEGREAALQGRNYIGEPEATLNSIYNTPMVGASGAIFGILIGFAMLFPNTKLHLLFPPIPLKAKVFVGIYVAIELYLGYANNPTDNVAHFAHLGGALFGFILILIWRKDRSNFY